MDRQHKVIISVFAGRQLCMKPLITYMNQLLEQKHIDTIHIWNFARKHDDDVWLKKTFPHHVSLGKYKQVTTNGFRYINTGLVFRLGEKVNLSVQAESSAYILLRSLVTGTCIETCIGGWNNTRSVVRHGIQGEIIGSVDAKLLKPLKFVNVKIDSDPEYIKVVVGNQEVCLSSTFNKTSDVLEVYVSSWHDQISHWRWYDAFEFHIHDDLHPIKLINVSDKTSWLEYYGHYTQYRYPNNVICKVDDDIVFIDCEMFPYFIKERLKNTEDILMFPSIVNNELMAFVHQNEGLFPKDDAVIGQVDYHPLGLGDFWENGKKCQKLHELFLKTRETFIRDSKGIGVKFIPINHRCSINFFAIVSRDLYLFKFITQEDEIELTQIIPGLFGRGHAIFMDFVVSHLSFGPQRKSGLNEEEISHKYLELSIELQGKYMQRAKLNISDKP